MAEVYIAECRTYEEEKVKEAMAELLDESGLLSFVRPDMTVGIKANLVSFMKPEAAATTHPTVLKVLCDMLAERGAKCIIGDSPGGLYNSVFVGRVYSATGMKSLENEKVSLNRNFGQNTPLFKKGGQSLEKFKSNSRINREKRNIGIKRGSAVPYFVNSTVL